MGVCSPAALPALCTGGVRGASTLGSASSGLPLGKLQNVKGSPMTEDVGPGVRTARVQTPPLPLLRRGISGQWLCFFVPQFPHPQNGSESTHLEGLF